MPRLTGPRPDPGAVGGEGLLRKRDRLKKQIREHPITKIRKRTKDVLEATKAIKAGHAEAHPRMLRKGAMGTIEATTEQARDIGETFAKSLARTEKARRKSYPPARMPTPAFGDEFAGVRKPTRPVRTRARTPVASHRPTRAVRKRAVKRTAARTGGR